jgi:hypothetical protein
MDDKHAAVVIQGLIRELQTTSRKLGILQAVIALHVADKWDKEIQHQQELPQDGSDIARQRLYEFLAFGAPGSNPPEGYESIVQRILGSLE